MKSIVYGIVDARDAARKVLPTGPNEAKLVAVEHGQLAALLSPLSREMADAAGIDQALAYARVVGQLHSMMTIIPMRYGCFVNRPEHAAEFLRRHESEFSEALATLEGCDEMGLRTLLPSSGTTGPSARADPSAAPSAKHRGAAYLSNRREFYEQQALAEQACREWVERARAAFSGLFRDSRWEYAVRPEGMLISLSFLVERSKVPAFKEAFQRFERDLFVKAICSGPWPPYVFVEGLAKPDTAARAEKEFLHLQKG